MTHLRKILLSALGVSLATAAVAQNAPPSKPLSTSLGVVVFPAQGQGAQQQAQDEGECYAWSKGQTGVDPMAPAPAAAQTTQQPASQSSRRAGGERVRGAARGAAAGAVVGEIASDDAGEGAAIGATLGVVKGGSESRKNRAQAEEQSAEAAQQQTAEQQAAQQQQMDLFRKGFAACLETKGYTVK